MARFRTQQAAQFSQLASIDRPTGEPTFVAGVYGQPVTSVGVDVACKVSSVARDNRDGHVGETIVRLMDLTVKFPVGTDVELDDLVTVTASSFDVDDVGRQYRVTMIDRGEWQVSRKCVVEEVSVPMLHEVA